MRTSALLRFACKQREHLNTENKRMMTPREVNRVVMVPVIRIEKTPGFSEGVQFHSWF